MSTNAWSDYNTDLFAGIPGGLHYRYKSDKCVVSPVGLYIAVDKESNARSLGNSDAE